MLLPVSDGIENWKRFSPMIASLIAPEASLTPVLSAPHCTAVRQTRYVVSDTKGAMPLCVIASRQNLVGLLETGPPQAALSAIAASSSERVLLIMTGSEEMSMPCAKTSSLDL